MLWSAATSPGADFGAGATVAEGVVYAGANDGKLYAFNAANGALRWSAKIPGGATPAVVGGLLYTVGGGFPGSLYVLRAANGALLWQAGTYDNAIDPLVAHGSVFVGDNGGDIYGRSSAGCGSPQCWGWPWRFHTAENGSTSHISGLAVAYGTLFAGSSNGILYVLDPHTGALRWRGSTGGEITDSPSIAAGVVWVGTQDGHLDAFPAHGCGSATCQPLASIKISQGEPLYASPAIANGTVYIASYDRRLVALSTR